MSQEFRDLIQQKNTFSEKLLNWYKIYQRPLPWRSSPSLYKTVVSEFMLQQTQVATVLPYFERWMKRFRDFKALAEATENEVLKHWEGLGYYNRARKLHQLAQAISYQAEIPLTATEWQKFDGIGPYTAAAIASIAFDDRTAVVDGNVIRVLSRLTAYNQVLADNTMARKVFAPLAQELMPQDPISPGDYNQALMELGATLCLPQKTNCNLCPAQSFCRSSKQSDPTYYPQYRPRIIEKIVLDRIWLFFQEFLLLQKAHKQSRRLAAIYELPNLKDLSKVSMPLYEIQSLKILNQKRRGIGNQQITERIYTPSDQVSFIKSMPYISMPSEKFTLLEKSDVSKHSDTLENIDPENRESLLKEKPTGIFTLDLSSRKENSEHEFKWVHWGKIDSIVLSGPHRRWIYELRAQYKDSQISKLPN